MSTYTRKRLEIFQSAFRFLYSVNFQDKEAFQETLTTGFQINT